jgi:hypothetical protein
MIFLLELRYSYRKFVHQGHFDFSQIDCKKEEEREIFVPCINSAINIFMQCFVDKFDFCMTVHRNIFLQWNQPDAQNLRFI